MDRRSPSPDDLNRHPQNRAEKQPSDASSSSRLQELRDHHLRSMSFNLGQASNGVAIGKPVEKRIVLSERYGKDNPGLAGGVTGILETFGTAAVSWAVKKGLSKLWEFGQNTIMGKKESAEEKLDRLFMSYYKTGLNHLENATKTHDDQRREGSIHNAANHFMMAANIIETGCFVKAKSMLSVAGCHHWIREYDIAKHWLSQAYEEGLAECKRSHPRDELAQFKSEFLVPLEKLLQSYPPTSDSTAPLLTQFSRLETGSSSSISDRLTKTEQKLEKKVSFSGTSSLQKGDAGSPSTGREWTTLGLDYPVNLMDLDYPVNLMDLDYPEPELMVRISTHHEEQQQLLDRLKTLGFKPNDYAWFIDKGEAFLKKYMHEFIQTEQGKAWFSNNGEQWLDSWDGGKGYLRGYVHNFIQTEQGKAWFSGKGKQWFDSSEGESYMRWRAHNFIQTEQGKAWFSGKGEQWLDSSDGKCYLENNAHEFIQTEQGKAWFSGKGEQWFDSSDAKYYLKRNALRFIKTEQGKAWFSEKGKQWLDSSDGKECMENSVWYLKEYPFVYSEMIEFLDKHGVIYS